MDGSFNAYGTEIPSLQSYFSEGFSHLFENQLKCVETSKQLTLLVEAPHFCIESPLLGHVNILLLLIWKK